MPTKPAASSRIRVRPIVMIEKARAIGIEAHARTRYPARATHLNGENKRRKDGQHWAAGLDPTAIGPLPIREGVNDRRARTDIRLSRPPTALDLSISRRDWRSRQAAEGIVLLAVGRLASRPRPDPNTCAVSQYHPGAEGNHRRNNDGKGIGPELVDLDHRRHPNTENGKRSEKR